MSDLSIKIKAHTEEASRNFKTLAEDSEVLRAKIKKLSDNMGNEKADRFIENQKLAAIAMQAAGKEAEVLQRQYDAYGRKIQEFIKSGLDPETEAVKKLQKEHEALGQKIRETTVVKQANEQAAKAAQAALAAVAVAAAAAGAAIGKMVQETAEAGDAYAKTSRMIGMTAEAYQEIEYAAKQSGLSGDELRGSLQKLNKGMADLKSGTGSLQKYLAANDAPLLENMKSCKSSEQAFMLLTDAIKKAPNEFDRAALAQAAFGKSGQELINFAENGAEGIEALREEARKYGIISNEAAEQSEKYIDAQGRLKQALAGARNEIAESLIPVVTDVIEKAANFIAGIDDWEGVIRKAAIAIAAATASLVAFTTVMKIAAVINKVKLATDGLTFSVRGLTAAIAANPIGLIATGVAVGIGILTTVIGSHIAKQKELRDSARGGLYPERYTRLSNVT